MPQKKFAYSRTQRTVEIVSIFAFLTLTLVHTFRLFWSGSHNLWQMSAGFCLSIFAADFMSGFVHWAADTWGTPEWPVVGKSLIQPFREHHTDEKSITRHDFIETNGNNCLVCIPVLLGLFFFRHLEISVQSFFFSLVLGLTTWIFFTNQFHKWSHQDEIPRVIQLLQKLRLILPADHHQFHHRAPYLENYCITTGWMNPLLARLQFFSRLEKLITKITSATPRNS